MASLPIRTAGLRIFWGYKGISQIASRFGFRSTGRDIDSAISFFARYATSQQGTGRYLASRNTALMPFFTLRSIHASAVATIRKKKEKGKKAQPEKRPYVPPRIYKVDERLRELLQIPKFVTQFDFKNHILAYSDKHDLEGRDMTGLIIEPNKQMAALLGREYRDSFYHRDSFEAFGKYFTKIMDEYEVAVEDRSEYQELADKLKPRILPEAPTEKAK